jgi:gluconate 5-dehydrogenase
MKKVAIVTGGTSGMGEATVQELTKRGWHVASMARSKSEFQGDVSEDKDCRRVAKAVLDKWGRIDALVNNAGINPARVKPEDMTLEYWRKVFCVNLEGPLRTSQCVFPIMREQGSGSIVHIGTMAAYSGGSAVCAYGASKAALLNLTKSQASEWAQHGIRVNLLSPGPFMSEMMEGGERTAPGFFDLVASGTFMKRIADPGEIVGPVCYLVSDASSFVTGDDLSVSGGMFK